MKDTDRFQYELDRPLEGRATVVTEEDLDADAESFMAFTSAMGIKPPPATAEAAV